MPSDICLVCKEGYERNCALYSKQAMLIQATRLVERTISKLLKLNKSLLFLVDKQSSLLVCGVAPTLTACSKLGPNCHVPTCMLIIQ